MIIIATPTKRLCKDNCLREFAMFGTFKECVKTYVSKSAAIRKARYLNGLRLYKNPNAEKLVAIEITEDMHIDACGRVTRMEPATPGFEKVIEVPYSEILIPI
jgi:hypothetical protein